MKKFILSLFAAIAVLFSVAQSPDETAARTLGLPPQFAQYHNYWITGSEAQAIEIIKYVDRAKSRKDSTKMVNGRWRYSYTNAPDTYSISYKQVTTTYPMSNHYLLNYISGFASMPGGQVDHVSNTIVRKGVEADYYWTGNGKYELINSDKGFRLKITGTLGLSNNILQKKYSRVNGQSVYTNPTDWKGRVIEGVDVDNQGATPNNIAIHYNNRYLRVSVITITETGVGSFSTSNPVWSGGIKESKKTESLLVPLSELLEMLNTTEEQLREDLAVYQVCTYKDPSKFIVSTSSEIVQNGNSYTGITYYNGISTKASPPSGKTTSYEKQYPGHVVRWIFEADGITGARGGYQILQVTSSADNTIKVVKGNKYGYNASTNTFTYDRPGRLVFENEEGSMMTAQGKGHGNRIFVQLE